MPQVPTGVNQPNTQRNQVNAPEAQDVRRRRMLPTPTQNQVPQTNAPQLNTPQNGAQLNNLQQNNNQAGSDDDDE
jgi:hypothetical protein